MKAIWEPFFASWAGDDLVYAEAVIDGLPEQFYTAPASFTGKYHPPDEIGPGGLSIHAWRMASLSHDMARMIDDGASLAKPLLLAAIAHDAFKPVLTREEYWQHPLVAAVHVRDTRPDVVVPWRAECAWACAVHEGRWTAPGVLAPFGPESGYHPPERADAIRFAMHSADYILSRRTTWQIMGKVPA